MATTTDAGNGAERGTGLKWKTTKRTMVTKWRTNAFVIIVGFHVSNTQLPAPTLSVAFQHGVTFGTDPKRAGGMIQFHVDGVASEG